jgi:hypothetical protein
MKRIVLALLIVGCSSPAERAARAVIDKNAAARGGRSAWRQVRALSMTGTLEAGVPRDPRRQAEAALRTRTESAAEARRERLHNLQTAPKPVQLPFVLELRRPRESRLEIQFRDQTAVQVFDGTHGWKVRPYLGRREVEPFTDDELKLASQQAELDGPLLDLAATGDTAELLGRSTLDGRDVFTLAVRSPKGAVRQVLVDAETFLEVRVDGTRVLDGKPHRMWTTFRDYRAVDGLMIPHTLETTVEGVAGSEKIVVEHVALNPEVADARFSKPD